MFDVDLCLIWYYIIVTFLFFGCVLGTSVELEEEEEERPLLLFVIADYVPDLFV